MCAETERSEVEAVDVGVTRREYILIFIIYFKYYFYYIIYVHIIS